VADVADQPIRTEHSREDPETASTANTSPALMNENNEIDFVAK
jgi:hypothetical protein